MLPKKTLIVLPLAILAILLLPSLLALIQPTQTVQEGAKTDGIQNMFKLPLQPIVAEAALPTNAKPTLVSWYTITAKPTTATIKGIIDTWASLDKHVRTVTYLVYNDSMVWALISLYTAQPLPGGGGVNDLINVYVMYKYGDGMIIAYTGDLPDNDLGKLVTIEGIGQNNVPIIWLTTDYVVKQIIQKFVGDTSNLLYLIKRGSPKYPTAKWIVVLYSDCAGGINAYYRIYDDTKIVKMGYAATIKVCVYDWPFRFGGYIQVDGRKVVEAHGKGGSWVTVCASAYSSGSLGARFYSVTQHNIKVNGWAGDRTPWYDAFIALIFFIKGFGG